MGWCLQGLFALVKTRALLVPGHLCASNPDLDPQADAQLGQRKCFRSWVQTRSDAEDVQDAALV